jgi:hypothetical protein
MAEYLTGKVGFSSNVLRQPRSSPGAKIAFEMPDPTAIAPAALST